MSDTQAVCSICGEPMPPGEEMFKFHGYSGDCPKPPKPKERKNYSEHDDLCIWWDNVGKEPLDYTCTCGKWVEQLSASQSRVRELEGENERLKMERNRLEDKAYYEGARQASRMGNCSLDEMNKWIREGCGGRGPNTALSEQPRGGE